jgi:hypothetical protein
VVVQVTDQADVAPEFEQRPVEFQLLPALPGTRAFIFDGSEEGQLTAVQGWLIVVDVIETSTPPGDVLRLDLSCIRGRPLIVTAENDLEVAGESGAVNNKLVEILDPDWDEPSDQAKREHAAMVARYQAKYGGPASAQ